LFHLEKTEHRLPNGGFHIRLPEDLSFLEAPKSFGGYFNFYTDSFGENIKWKKVRRYISDGLFSEGDGKGKSRKYKMGGGNVCFGGYGLAGN